jgi:hypothetical protein
LHQQLVLQALSGLPPLLVLALRAWQLLLVLLLLVLALRAWQLLLVLALRAWQPLLVLVLLVLGPRLWWCHSRQLQVLVWRPFHRRH